MKIKIDKKRNFNNNIENIDKIIIGKIYLLYKKNLDESINKEFIINLIYWRKGKNTIAQDKIIKEYNLSGTKTQTINRLKNSDYFNHLKNQAFNNAFEEKKDLIIKLWEKHIENYFYSHSEKISFENLSNLLENEKIWTKNEKVKKLIEELLDKPLNKTWFLEKKLNIQQKEFNLDILLNNNIKNEEKLQKITNKMWMNKQFFEEEIEELNKLIESFTTIDKIENLSNLESNDCINKLENLFNSGELWKKTVLELTNNIFLSIEKTIELNNILLKKSSITYFNSLNDLYKNNQSSIEDCNLNENNIFQIFKNIFEEIIYIYKQKYKNIPKLSQLSHKKLDDLKINDPAFLWEIYRGIWKKLWTNTSIFNIFEIYTSSKILHEFIQKNPNLYEYEVILDKLKTINIKKNGTDYISLFRNIWDKQKGHYEIDLLYINYKNKSVNLIDSKFTTSNTFYSRYKKFEKTFENYYYNFWNILSYEINKEYLNYVKRKLEYNKINIEWLRLRKSKNRWIIAVWNIWMIVRGDTAKKFLPKKDTEIEMYDFILDKDNFFNINSFLWIKTSSLISKLIYKFLQLNKKL